MGLLHLKARGIDDPSAEGTSERYTPPSVGVGEIATPEGKRDCSSSSTLGVPETPRKSTPPSIGVGGLLHLKSKQNVGREGGKERERALNVSAILEVAVKARDPNPHEPRWRDTAHG